jgi:hypothetical protein
LGKATARLRESSYARDSLAEAFKVLTEVGDARCSARVQYQLGALDLDEGNPAGATARFTEALVMSPRVDDRPNMARALDGMGWVALLDSDTESAAVLIAAAERLRTTLKTHLPEEEKQRHEITLKELHQQSHASFFAGDRRAERAEQTVQNASYG